jgi:hypothetical protein
MLAVYKGVDIIYDNGKLNTAKYGENAQAPYTSTHKNDIEYLYAYEIHNQTLSEHIPLVKFKFM